LTVKERDLLLFRRQERPTPLGQDVVARHELHLDGKGRSGSAVPVVGFVDRVVEGTRAQVVDERLVKRSERLGVTLGHDFLAQGGVGVAGHSERISAVSSRSAHTAPEPDRSCAIR